MAGAAAMKEIQIFRKEIQAGEEVIPNPPEGNPNSDPQFPSPNRAFSRTCADPQSISYSSGRFRPRRRRRCMFASSSSSVLLSSFRVPPASLKPVKGWRLFMIAGRRAVVAQSRRRELAVRRRRLDGRAPRQHQRCAHRRVRASVSLAAGPPAGRPSGSDRTRAVTRLKARLQNAKDC